MRRFFLSTLSLLLLSAPGCGSAAFEQPEVTLQGVRIAGLGMRGGTLLVNLAIQNPNPYALAANSVRYDVAVADMQPTGDTTWVALAAGAYDQQLSVRPGETAEVEVPVEFTYAGLGGAASSLLQSGTFAYRATGVVDVSTPIGVREFPFRRDGVVALTGTN